MSDINSSSSYIQNVPPIEENNKTLNDLYHFLVEDEECNLVFSKKKDQVRLDMFVDETVAYAGDVKNLSRAELQDFLSVFIMYFLRVDDKLAYKSVQRRKSELADALAALLCTKTFADQAIILCSNIYENTYPDALHGSNWGEHFLDDNGLSDIIIEIADNENKFWPARAVKEAKILFPD